MSLLVRFAGSAVDCTEPQHNKFLNRREKEHLIKSCNRGTVDAELDLEFHHRRVGPL